jgi:hypothetical protein
MGEDTFRQIYTRTFNQAYSIENKRYDLSMDAAIRAVADEAVRRYFAALPPGNNGLLRAFDEAWDQCRDATPVGRERMRAGIAAAIEVWKHLPEGKAWRDSAHPLDKYSKDCLVRLGWLTPDDAAKLAASNAINVKDAKDTAVAEYYANLPPGDEGMVAAFNAAARNTRCVDLPAGIAAVLDLYRRRLRERWDGLLLAQTAHNAYEHADVGDGGCAHGDALIQSDEAILERLDAEGWVPPDKAEELLAEKNAVIARLSAKCGEYEAEIERLRDLPPGLMSPPPGIAVVDADQYAAMEAEIERLKAKLSDAQTRLVNIEGGKTCCQCWLDAAGNPQPWIRFDGKYRYVLEDGPAVTELKAARDRWRERAESWMDSVDRIRAAVIQETNRIIRERTSKMDGEGDG